MKSYDIETGMFVNQAALPAESEVGYDGNATEAYWSRIFDEGEGVGVDSVQRLSAVWACVTVLSSAIGTMPLQLIRQDGETSQIVTDHRTAGFLQDAPSEALTWAAWKEGIMWQLLFSGNAYTQNFFRNGYIDEVFLWDQNTIKPNRFNRKIAYQVGANEYGIPARNYFRPEMSHFKSISQNGIEGVSPIQHCKNALDSAGALGRYQLSSARKGSPLRGVMTGAPVFKNKEKADEVRAQWETAFQRGVDGNGVPIFTGEMTYQNVSMTNTDAQFLEQMRFGVEDVARIFNVPPHQIQHLEKATNNNIDLLNQEFYKSSLLPYKNRIESVATRDWLTADDRRKGYRITLNPDEFLRADVEKWTNSLAKQVAGGLRTPNEARARLDLAGVPDGDELRIPANTVPVGHDPSDSIGTSSQPPQGDGGEGGVSED